MDGIISDNFLTDGQEPVSDAQTQIGLQLVVMRGSPVVEALRDPSIMSAP